MQGLRPSGRRLFVEAALSGLQDLLTSMPDGAQSMGNAKLCRVARAAAVLLAVQCCEQCLGYVPQTLQEELGRSGQAITQACDGATQPSAGALVRTAEATAPGPTNLVARLQLSSGS